ncbi:lasso peptide biosynthesis B2 protein [Amycolatopsis thailandensis]|uniref:lasso peptide biosynthesis B2 protein n=1 Tax=Amycolatopsis thailandensis TaxID=589330 RepID=UPI00362F5FFB
MLPLLAVAVAWPLTTVAPRQLRRVLEFVRRGAPAATSVQAAAAHQAVVAVSMRCAGQGCLLRSIAVALLCRAHGCWPTWCTGVRTQPFTAHAWIEAEGKIIGEAYPPGHYTCMFTVGPYGEAPQARD